MKKIVILVAGYLPGFKSGGPVRTVSNMVAALGDEYCFSVVCCDRDIGDEVSYNSIDKNFWNRQGKANVFYIQRGLVGIKNLIKIFRKNHFDIFYLNSFFSFQFSIIPLLILRIFHRNTPIILGPRGEFSLGALAIKSFKKRVFIGFSMMFGLYKNVIWHASTNYESEDIKRVIGSKAIIRIAIDITMTDHYFLPLPCNNDSSLKVIFISRVSPKKNLLGALSLLLNVRRKVHFDVYGPAEDEVYWNECRAVAKVLPKNIVFAYCGVLQPSEIAPTLAKYDLFLFPTFGENYGHVIAEALTAGLPILISDTTPWRDLAIKKLGWDIPLDQPDRFVACIEECCIKSAEAYDQWRRDIRAWAVANIGNQNAVDENRQLFNNLD